MTWQQRVNLFIITLSVLIALACSTKENPKDGLTTKIDIGKKGTFDSAWVPDRVASSTERLTASEAGKILLRSIGAHGGLRKWFLNGPIAFQFNYQPLDGGKVRNSFQTVDKWSVRIVHEVADNGTYQYGWDGKQAWSFPDSADVGVNPRFWSTTPYYFVGLPFVLSDEGIVLELMEDRKYKQKDCFLVKATFEETTGDAPDDFYVLYISKSDYRLVALRYIVSYPGFFEPGEHSPEKLMEITGFENIDGIQVPTGYRTFWFREQQKAEEITKIEVSNISFKGELPSSFFDMPPGAKVQQQL